MDDCNDPPASKRQCLDENAGTITTFEAPETNSPRHILNILCDNCLQEIFKRISILDLSNVSEVCTRFKQNAEEIFSLCHEKRFRFISLTLVRPQIVRNFVHLIKSTYLNGNRASHCLTYFNKDSRIQSLHVRNALINVDSLRSILSNLTTFEMSSCTFHLNQVATNAASDLLFLCRKLRNLKVKLTKFDQFYPCRMPTLEKFELDDYTYCETLRCFIKANPHLTFISITMINKMQTITDFEGHLLHFGSLQSLNSLKLPCYQRSVAPLVKSLRENNIQLQLLELSDCRVDDGTFLDLFEMKSIKILALTGIEGLSREQFVGLAKALPALEVLRLETVSDSRVTVANDDIQSFVEHSRNLYLLTIGVMAHVTVDPGMYNNLLLLMTKNSERKTLTITFMYKQSMTVTVSKETLLKNKQRIRIVGINNDSLNVSIGNGIDDDDDDDDNDGNGFDDHENGDDDDSDGSDNGGDDEENNDVDDLDGSNSSGSDSNEDLGEISDFDSIIESADDSDDNSDDSWLRVVYIP